MAFSGGHIVRQCIPYILKGDRPENITKKLKKNILIVDFLNADWRRIDLQINHAIPLKNQITIDDMGFAVGEIYTLIEMNESE